MRTLYYVVDGLRPIAECVSLDVALDEIARFERDNPSGRYQVMVTDRGREAVLNAYHWAGWKMDQMMPA